MDDGTHLVPHPHPPVTELKGRRECVGIGLSAHLSCVHLFVSCLFHCAYVVSYHGWFGWLDSFNAELSLKRYRQGPRSQEVGEEGDYT